MMKKYRIDINIVDNQKMFSEGLAEALNRSDILRVSRTFTTLEACRQALQERCPDVLLLDILMPDGDGISFCRQVVSDYPKVKVVAVTIHDEYSVVQRMLEAGVHGYVLKSSSVSTLIEAIVNVWQGGHYVSAEVNSILQRGQLRAISLTTVEQSVLRLVSDGFTNPEIAVKLSLSTETINWYRKRLLAKFGVRNTVLLVKQALKEMLV